MGIFLGYTDTMKNIHYYDVKLGHVKTAHHILYDESMSDLSDKPSNACMLANIKPNSLDVIDIAIETPDLDVSMTPFFQLQTFSMPFDPLAAEPISLSFCICQCLHHAYISDFHLAPTGFTLHSAHWQLLGSYVVSINNASVFRLNDIQHILLQHSTLDHPPTTLLMLLLNVLQILKSVHHLCIYDCMTFAILQHYSC